jgi:large subunit ribosomal protein L29
MKDSFKELTAEELAVKREDLRKQYNDARFNSVIGHVDNPLQERVLRRKLARVYTLIREFEKGIRTRADTVKAPKPPAAQE